MLTNYIFDPRSVSNANTNSDFVGWDRIRRAEMLILDDDVPEQYPSLFRYRNVEPNDILPTGMKLIRNGSNMRVG